MSAPDIVRLIRQEHEAVRKEWNALSNAVVPPETGFGRGPYPRPMCEDAYHGIAGKFVRLMEPHTEADPNWLLVVFLTYAGNLLGRNAYVKRDGYHYPNLFSCGVGPTSGGRKGTPFYLVESFFRTIEGQWFQSIQSGLSTGEGLIWHVRDPIFKRELTKSTGEYTESQVDPGVSDKRLLIRQTEFFGALQVMRRPGNTLSATVRDAWDRGDLNSMVKNSPARATGAHISIVAKVPPEELKRGLLAEEMDNGFANRFLWCCSIRSKFLPEGGGEEVQSGLQQLRGDFDRVDRSSLSGEVRLSGEAQDIWGYNDRPELGVYYKLARGRPGMLGQLTARAPQQVLRLALVFALLDGSLEIGPKHLEAALEVWRYCNDSCRYLFGDLIGDPTADSILNALVSEPGGMTRSEITRGLFQRNKKAEEIDRGLGELRRLGRAYSVTEDTGGKKHAERWYAV